MFLRELVFLLSVILSKSKKYTFTSYGMAVSREKKGEILAKLKKIVKDSASVVFINFHGLPVTESSNIRKTLKAKGVGYTVAKKSLTRKALAEGGIDGVMPELPGELGLVYLPDFVIQAGKVQFPN